MSPSLPAAWLSSSCGGRGAEPLRPEPDAPSRTASLSAQTAPKSHDLVDASTVCPDTSLYLPALEPQSQPELARRGQEPGPGLAGPCPAGTDITDITPALIVSSKCVDSFTELVTWK